MSSGSLAMMLSRYRPEIDKADRLDALGFDFVDGPDAYGLGRQFLVDRVKALIPMPLVGFKLALLVVVEIEQELRVFVLRGGFGHPRFLRFQNRSHGSCLLLRPLGQRETGAFGEFPPTFPQVWEQLRVVVDALGEEGWHTGMAVRPGLLLPGRIQLPLHRAASAVCSRIAYSDQKRPWCSYLLPAGEGAPQGRMRAELLALARKSPHPAVPARPRKRGSPRPPREKERRPRRACNSTVKRAKPRFPEAALRIYDKDLADHALRQIPAAIKFNTTGEFREYLTEKLRFDSQATRRRAAGYLIG